ncbi:Transcriptional regulator in cluster with unspecified monosaccharide ABC transport system [Streptococcus gallolyticus]|uniref:Transcriptional regulator in cluster with unspecified monosaccharide ABC transport system n=1 Tax=Streptococcus gallolyticus TaxID=315405 RepID=A0A139NAL1_9STRE|nr:RodZ domain-containing protein [Streptococcus gallolyticus]KXT73089.1 Transcriptional regulator in cluster with unspecified monosaccharide ABC transport system [Streptococcus gallolyticus]
MREQTIGEILREARVAKHLTLEEVEEKTAIPSPHLLALELEQFKLIPKDKIETYLQQYSEAVDLDTADLLEKYHEQEVDSSEEEQEEHVVESTTTNTESIVKTPQDETISIAKSASDDSFIIGSRSSRYKGKEKTNSYLPIVMLCLVALGILAFVSFVTWNQLQSDSNNASTSYSVVHSSSSTTTDSTSSESSSSTSESSSSEEDTSLKMSTEGSGNSLTVNLSNVTDSLTVEISLSGADSSWVSVTNSESNDSGTLLSSTGTTSYTAVLPSGTTSSLITLGVTEGVTVTIDGQEVDTSALTSTTLSYITINIQ